MKNILATLILTVSVNCLANTNSYILKIEAAINGEPIEKFQIIVNDGKSATYSQIIGSGQIDITATATAANNEKDAPLKMNFKIEKIEITGRKIIANANIQAKQNHTAEIKESNLDKESYSLKVTATQQ